MGQTLPGESTVGKLLRRGSNMKTASIVYWEAEGGWIGYFLEFPDYWTQGETRDDLREHLKDLYDDLCSGEISGLRRVEELVVA